MNQIQNVDSCPDYINKFIHLNMEQLCKIYDEGMELNPELEKGILFFVCSQEKNKMDVQFMNDEMMSEILQKDSLMQLNAGASTNANDCGLIIERGSTGDNATIFWDESADKWTLGLTTDTADSTGNMSNFTKGTLVANLDTTTITNATIDCGTYAN